MQILLYLIEIYGVENMEFYFQNGFPKLLKKNLIKVNLFVLYFIIFSILMSILFFNFLQGYKTLSFFTTYSQE